MNFPKRIFYKKEYERKAVFLLFFLGGTIVIQFLIIGYLATSTVKIASYRDAYAIGCFGNEDPK